MSAVVVGVSAFYHDAACCVLRDGRLVAAAQEERFTRLKHDASLPRHAFRYCLEEAGITIADVDCVAYYEQPVKKLGRQLWSGLPRAHPSWIASIDPARPVREIREVFGYDGRLEFVDHHVSHAASSFFFSGFSEAAVMTVDGVGEWATTTYGRADGSQIELFEEVQFPHSIGLFYAAMTSYLGFSVNDGEYKVMGLAPYGAPAYVDPLRRVLRSLPRGQFELALEYFDFTSEQRMYTDRLPALLGRPARDPESEIEPFHQDVARSLQVVLEEILLEKARYLHGRVRSTRLCMAGGVALNCVANGRLLREGPFRELFVQPASDDAGAALGAAAVAHARLTGERVAREPLRDLFLGPGYSSSEVAGFFANTPLAVQDYRGREDALLAETARRLAQGKVIGWFQGRMEFGPRALGGRSIIADARGPEMRDRINALVKKREGFRPFAPAVLLARAEQHFELSGPSPFMLLTHQVRSQLDLPAVTHVDGSARVQTVDPERQPRFAGLLAEFERLTGCPILLNTSFNRRGEPIVCSPADGLLCFVLAALDTLVIEDFLLDREALPAAWPELAKRLDAKPSRGEGHAVYTLW